MAIYFKSFPFPNDIQHSSNCDNCAVTAIAITTMSVSTVRMSTFLMPSFTAYEQKFGCPPLHANTEIDKKHFLFLVHKSLSHLMSQLIVY